jgi:CBS domain containing-hemolysin-like protein
VRKRLRKLAKHQTEIDSVAMRRSPGQGDRRRLGIRPAGQRRRQAAVRPDRPDDPPVTLRPDDDLDKVATEMVESRRSSLLVVDEKGRPLGRILSDDVLDALVPGHGRLHFPRILQ